MKTKDILKRSGTSPIMFDYYEQMNQCRMTKKSLHQGCRGINKLSMKLSISTIFDIYLTTFKLGYNSKCFKENIKFLLLNHTAVMEIVVKMVIGFIRLCLNEFRSENSKVYILDRNGMKIIVGQKRNNLYYVRDIVDKKEETAASTMAGNKNKPSLFSHIKIQMCNYSY
jgi:hypothetical protein